MAEPDSTSDLALGKAVDYKRLIDTDFITAGWHYIACSLIFMTQTTFGRLISRQPRALNRLAKKLSPKGKRWLPIVCARIFGVFVHG